MRVPPAAGPRRVEWTHTNIHAPLSRSRWIETDSPSQDARRSSTDPSVSVLKPLSLTLSPRGRGKSGSLGVLDDRQDSRRHETSRAHDASVARQLADLDARARAAHLDAAAGAGRLDDVPTRDAASGVDQNLDEISLCHTYLLFPIGGELRRSI